MTFSLFSCSKLTNELKEKKIFLGSVNDSVNMPGTSNYNNIHQGDQKIMGSDYLSKKRRERWVRKRGMEEENEKEAS